MDFDRFGLNKEFCEKRGFKVFLGTDWLDDSEYKALENLSRGRKLSLSIIGSEAGPISFDSFHDAIKLESQFVDVDKIIQIDDCAIIYVSDDRDLFLVAATEETLSVLVQDIVSAGGKTYSSLVQSGIVVPQKQVKSFFDEWTALNFEIG